ncbi:xylulokinase [Mesobaculum littorinae]|nr:xylulokinase [Mesobaculum littorinae]
MQLGLDLGTSAVKAVIATPERGVVARADAPLQVQTPGPYACEQAPEDWWRAVRQVSARLAREAPEAWRAISAIGLSGQMHGAVLLDASGAVIRPAILWNDGRAFRECATLARDLPGIGALAGVPPLPGFPAPKLMWLAEAEPAAHARIARMLMPKDWLGLRLHGQAVTDPSDAAGTLLFDQARRDWSAPLMQAAGVARDWLPRILGSAEIAGRLRPDAAAELGLPAGLPVAAGAGDTAAGAVGLGVVGRGDGMISVGTSGQILLPTRRFRPDPDRMIHAFAHAVPEMWYRMAALLNGARPMAWFAGVAGARIGTLLDEAAAARDAPLCLPYLTGERTPHGDPHLRGAFWGMGYATSRGEMMRGVVEAVAFSFADAAEALAEGPLPSLLATGGGTRSDLLMQMIADLLGVEIARADDMASGPAYGAARLAAVAVGRMTPGDLAAKPAALHRFAPRAAVSRALAGKLDRFRALHAALAPLAAEEGGRVPQSGAAPAGLHLAAAATAEGPGG